MGLFREIILLLGSFVLCSLRENCPTPECLESCENIFVECVSDCSENPTCLSQCSRDQAECIDDCPCKNESILMLNTFTYSNVPMLVDFSGNVNDDLGFTYEEDMAVRYGCSATLHGEFWYFGGSDTTIRQASKIVNCELKRQTDLEFDFYGGSCNSFMHPEPRILLCFGYDNSKECHTFDGVTFGQAGSTKDSHRLTLGMGNYNNMALTTGCDDYASCWVKTELMDLTTLEWTDGPDYPFSNYINRYSTASTASAAYIIGGFTNGLSNNGLSNTIAEFKDETWRQLGSMTRGRFLHGSIAVGNQIMIIGGYASGNSPIETEVWDIENGTYEVIEPTLSYGHYAFGIALFSVDSNFCAN